MNGTYIYIRDGRRLNEVCVATVMMGYRNTNQFLPLSPLICDSLVESSQ